MRDVAIVTCTNPPEPDPDEPILLAALAEAGVSATLAAWNDPAVDWSRYGVAVVRSTWDYYLYRDSFLAWAARVSRATALLNPAALLAWNTDKAYLGELAGKGLRVVPTVYVERGETRDLGALMDERGWSRVVVKPRVSAGSFETYAFDRAGLTGGELAARAADRPVMVQPYVRAVDDYGERSLVWIDGELTHAIRKSPRFAGGHEAVTEATIDPAERAFAEEVLAAVGEPLLYARVDTARGDDGQVMLMELEIVEPSLFLKQSARACQRLVAAIAARAKAQGDVAKTP